jgi:hypothetical protein
MHKRKTHPHKPTPHDLAPHSHITAWPIVSGWGMNHLSAMRHDYLGFVWGLQSQYGDIAYLKIFNEHITHVFHPDWVCDIG